MSLIRFTTDHEWIRLDTLEVGAIATVGITDYAQQHLGDIVFVDLPEPEAYFTRGQEVVVLESIKAAAEIYAPLDGQIQERNTVLTENPSMINTAPLGEGWLFTMRITNTAQLDELMDQTAYQTYLENLT